MNFNREVSALRIPALVHLVGPTTRVSARVIISEKLSSFCKLIKRLIAHNILKKLEFVRHRLAIKFLHGGVKIAFSKILDFLGGLKIHSKAPTIYKKGLRKSKLLLGAIFC